MTKISDRALNLRLRQLLSISCFIHALLIYYSSAAWPPADRQQSSHIRTGVRGGLDSPTLLTIAADTLVPARSPPRLPLTSSYGVEACGTVDFNKIPCPCVCLLMRDQFS